MRGRPPARRRIASGLRMATRGRPAQRRGIPMATTQAARWYLVSTDGCNWPGVLPWRRHLAARRGRGYPSEDDARRRALRIATAYAAAHGNSGPTLHVRMCVCDDATAYGTIPGVELCAGGRR